MFTLFTETQFSSNPCGDSNLAAKQSAVFKITKQNCTRKVTQKFFSSPRTFCLVAAMKGPETCKEN